VESASLLGRYERSKKSQLAEVWIASCDAAQGDGRRRAAGGVGADDEVPDAGAVVVAAVGAAEAGAAGPAGAGVGGFVGVCWARTPTGASRAINATETNLLME